jgi:hypothetical protein
MSTCSTEMSPSRCAAARCGRTGPNGSPVIDIRSLNAFAARTRRAASPTLIRTVSANNRGSEE